MSKNERVVERRGRTLTKCLIQYNKSQSNKRESYEQLFAVIFKFVFAQKIIGNEKML